MIIVEVQMVDGSFTEHSKVTECTTYDRFLKIVQSNLTTCYLYEHIVSFTIKEEEGEANE